MRSLLLFSKIYIIVLVHVHCQGFWDFGILVFLLGLWCCTAQFILLLNGRQIVLGSGKGITSLLVNFEGTSSLLSCWLSLSSRTALSLRWGVVGTIVIQAGKTKGAHLSRRSKLSPGFGLHANTIRRHVEHCHVLVELRLVPLFVHAGLTILIEHHGTDLVFAGSHTFCH